MFSVQKLWESSFLAHLKEVYDRDPEDRRLVVVLTNDNNDVDIGETEILHICLKLQKYSIIPTSWEDSKMMDRNVVHISQQEQFGVILLGQELGNELKKYREQFMMNDFFSKENQ